MNGDRDPEADESEPDQDPPTATSQLKGDLVRYLPSQAIPALIAFFTIPILTRLLTTAEFGEYRLILAAVGAFGAAGSWVASAIYRFYPEAEMSERLDSFRGTLQGLMAFTLGVFSVLWLGGLWAARTVFDVGNTGLYLLGGGLMVATSIWGVVNAQVRAVREVNWYSISVVLNKALTLGVGVGLVVWTGLRVDGLILGSIAASLLLLPFLVRVVTKNLPRTGAYDSRLARQMMRFGLPIALVQLASWMLQLSDRFLIAALRSTDEVGLYSAAYGIAEQGLETILIMFELPFAVLASRVWEREGREAAAQFVTRSAGSHLLVAIPAWAGLSVLARPIMAVMTGPEYHEASSIMPFVSLAVLLGAIQWWYSAGATFNKKTGQIVMSVGAAVVVNVVLNLLLLARFGYRAAAVTTLVAYGVGAVVMAVLTRRDFVWRFPFASVGRASVAAGVMAAVLSLIMTTTDLGPASTVATAIPLGVIVYGLALVATGEPIARRLAGRIFRRT